MVKAYGSSLFARVHWREIYKRRIELSQNGRDSDLAAANSSVGREIDASKDLAIKLRKILTALVDSDRWEEIFAQEYNGTKGRIEADTEHMRQFLEGARWQGIMVGVSKEVRNGNSPLKGEALIIARDLNAALDSAEAAGKRAAIIVENSVRRDFGVPLIGEGWVTETELFNTVVAFATPRSVLRHARLPWLGRQHLDVFIPDWALAIEYQGEQHSVAIEHFGGEEGLKKRKALDNRKKTLCKQNGVSLLYFYPSDDMSLRGVERAITRHLKG